ncbi:TMEM175 family protein [Actinoallomurus sp. NPDC050550]|uniref:TMEM175 family protein n=1 Tax=Actinoallomurus sp. NPDC050550 TaxID=3154937 RepID=UPI003405BF50
MTVGDVDRERAKPGLTDTPERVEPAPGDTPERMAMFTDAIFAIAMTLLVIEIKRPEGDALKSSASLWRFLTHEWESFFAFFLAFALLWTVWRRHHVLMDQVDRLDRAFTAWHAPLLLFVALLPFPTALLGHAIDNPLALCVFAGSEAALLFSEAALKEVAHRSRSILSPGADMAEVRRGASSSWAVAGFFAVTAALPWAVPAIPFAWLLAPAAATYGGRLIDRFRRDAGPVAA